MADQRALRVFVIDDDEDIREVLSQVLTARGYLVDTAAGGSEALARLRSGPPPALILLDLRMPGMSGWEFRREQRRDPAIADIPVVILSGGAGSPMERMTLDAADVLYKPVDLDELTRKVARHARRH